MKLTDMKAGMEVAVKTWGDHCVRGIVVDPAMWGRKRGYTKNEDGNHVAYLNVTLLKGSYTRNFPEKGVPVAVQDYHGEWTCRFVPPNRISGLWADHASAVAAKKQADQQAAKERQDFDSKASVLKDIIRQSINAVDPDNRVYVSDYQSDIKLSTIGDWQLMADALSFYAQHKQQALVA